MKLFFKRPPEVIQQLGGSQIKKKIDRERESENEGERERERGRERE